MVTNPERPRLPDNIEEKFVETDKRSAMAYTLLEHNAALMDELLGGQVIGPLEVTESLLQEVRGVIQAPRDPADSDEQHAEGRREVVGRPDER